MNVHSLASLPKMLIDEYLPEYDFDERHAIDVAASPETIYAAAKQIDFSESFIVRWLLRLRGMSVSRLTLDSFSHSKFKVLGEVPGREFLVGLAGRFWLPWGNLQDIDAASFRKFDRPGFAKAVWNFSVEKDGNGSHLSTETRIKCLDASSRRSFGFYWTFIQPFSGLIRMEMLRSIKRKAETL